MKIGDKVRTSFGDEGAIIDKFMNDFDKPVYIVYISDDKRVKALEDDLTLIEDKPEGKKITNPEEILDREFTMTLREFTEIVGKVSAKECKGKFMLGVSMSLFGAKLSEEIYRKKFIDD